jgi:hypothetical protein
MGDVNQNIIFRIGSKLGPGGFASLQSAVQLLSQMSGKIIEVAKEAEKFAQVHSKLTTDISAADRATKGLIDTMALMRNANILVGSGLNVTSEQFEAMNKLAVQYAQATGTDATEASNRLTNALAKGSTEAFRDFGIDVRNATSMVELQTKALQGIVEKADGVTVNIETASEAIGAMNNNLSTSIGLLWEAADANSAFGDTLDGVNSAWAEFNEALEIAPDALSDYIFELDHVGVFLANWVTNFVENITNFMATPLLKLADLTSGVFGIELGAEEGLDGAIQKMRSWASSLNDEEEKIFKDRVQQARDRRDKAESMAGVMGLTAATGGTSIFDMPDTAAGGGRGGAAGGRGGGGREMEFSLEDVEKFEQQELDDLLSRPEVRPDVGVSDLFDRPEVIDETQLALEKEEIEILQQKDEMRRERHGSFGDAWAGAYDAVGAGAIAAAGAQQMFKSATGAMVKAAIKGGKGMKEALRATLEEVGTAIAIESTWRGLMETGMAIAAAARQDYSTASQHIAAAAVLFATAAVAGTAAGIAASNAPKSPSAIASSASPSSVAQSATGTSAQEAFSPDDPRRQKEQQVVIHLSYDDEGILTAVKRQNDSASMSGESHFATVAS